MDNLFSIIVPIYNSEEYLYNCLDSIINQKFTDFELIAVDDGSTDRSGIICDEYASKDSRVKVIHKKNGGLSSARNAGLDIAEGKYIMFVDSDDELCDNDVLAILHEYVIKAPEVDVFITKTWTNSDFDDASGEELLTFLIDSAYKENKFSVGVWDKVYRHSFIRDNSIMFEDGFIHEDLLWTFKALAAAKKCRAISRKFYKRNMTNDSLTRSHTDKSYYNRAFSKLNITKFGTDYFKDSEYSDELKSAVYEFYIGIYINGMAEGAKIKDSNNRSKYIKSLKDTSDIFLLGIKTKNKKYKLLSIVYRLIGYKVVQFLIEKKYR